MKEEKNKKLFTSESVTEGHPDKLCDLISDSILDACLQSDQNSRVACEVMAGKEKIFVTGEITSSAKLNIEEIVRKTLKNVGYCDEKSGISCESCEIIVNLSKQSEDIALGVDKSLEGKENIERLAITDKNGENNIKDNNSFLESNVKETENFLAEGAGDQGMMFGYACDETENYMPMPIDLAHKLTKRLSEVRKTGEIEGLLPDGKAQVTVEYENEKPIRIDTIVVSTQHTEEKDLQELRTEVKEKVIKKVIPNELLNENTKYYINPTGRFVVGGPMGDSGLTGRKIIVDTYGGYARHGGGAFSGKDPTKVDRSAAYMARFIAKNLVANGYAKRCEIQLSYAIGVAKPVSIHVETFDTSKYSEKELLNVIEKNFDLTPRGIMTTLDLKRPIYTQTTNYGHFGKEEMTWEKIISI